MTSRYRWISRVRHDMVPPTPCKQRTWQLSVRLLIVALLLAVTPPSLACECILASDFEQWIAEHFDSSATVFIGTPISRRDLSSILDSSEIPVDASDEETTLRINSIEFEFAVERAFKGNRPPFIRVRTWPGAGHSCGVDFQEGQPFVVFAAETESKTFLHTNICTPTLQYSPSPTSRFQVTLEALEKMVNED